MPFPHCYPSRALPSLSISLSASPHQDSQVSSELVEGAGQGHHLVSGPADDRDAEHGLQLTAQHALQLLHILLQRGGVSGRTEGARFRPQPSTMLCNRRF